MEIDMRYLWCTWLLVWHSLVVAGLRSPPIMLKLWRLADISTVSTEYLQYLHSRYLGWTVDVAAATPAPRLTQRTGLHQWRWWVGHNTVQRSSAQQQPFYRETTIQMISSSWAAAASRLPQWKHFKLCLIIATSKHWILSAFNKDLKIFSVEFSTYPPVSQNHWHQIRRELLRLSGMRLRPFANPQPSLLLLLDN